MPLWKIAWRSIQRRSLASVLTMLSMALGVMLVVAVLLIVGVVDRSFQSNSSLGYDTIVGAKGGQLQLTLNTVYYLSQPVENLPFKFYQEFLPAESEMRDPRKDDGIAGEHYVNRVEFEKDGQWQPAEGEITIPAGKMYVRLRVPKTDNALESDKKFKLRLERTTETTVSDASATATATLLAERDESLEPEDVPEAPEPIPGMKKRKQTTLKVNSVVVQPNDEYAVFYARLFHVIGEDVKFTASLMDGYDGEYVPYLMPDKVSAIPVCLGDYLGQFRVVGTTPEFFDMVFDLENGRSYEFADGHNFTGDGEHGVFEAIVGAKVAREHGYRVGDLIQPSHGSPDGEVHDDFEIVGILKSSGTPQDRAVFVNMRGFNLIPQHIREDKTKEITSLLVDTKDPLRSRDLVHTLSEGPVGQAVKPVSIIYGLFSSIVGPIRNLLLVITLLICVVSGIGILVSIYNSMSDRKKEIAVMRALGAGRSTVMTVVLLESVMISMIGGLLGWLAGHAVIGLASGKIESETGVVVSAFQLAPPMRELTYLLGEQLAPTISVEIWLIPLLIFLAIAVGFLPAWTAYRTDVAEALQSSP